MCLQSKSASATAKREQHAARSAFSRLALARHGRSSTCLPRRNSPPTPVHLPTHRDQSRRGEERCGQQPHVLRICHFGELDSGGHFWFRGDLVQASVLFIIIDPRVPMMMIQRQGSCVAATRRVCDAIRRLDGAMCRREGSNAQRQRQKGAPLLCRRSRKGGAGRADARERRSGRMREGRADARG